MAARPIAVLDTAAFLSGYVNPNYDNYTVHEVVEELKGFGIDFEKTHLAPLVSLVQPSAQYFEHAKRSALVTGDYSVLSKTDLLVVGLAAELKNTTKKSVTVFTDDYALANLAGFLGINHSFVGLRKDGFRLLRWVWYCPACHRVYFANQRFCEECGSQLKRKPR